RARKAMWSFSFRRDAAKRVLPAAKRNLKVRFSSIDSEKQRRMSTIASPGQLRAGYVRWALVFVPLIVLLGLLSGKLSGSGAADPWFAALEKPDVYPPAAAFGIVWSLLYALMGFALAMVVNAQGAVGRGLAIAAFGVQLAL